MPTIRVLLMAVVIAAVFPGAAAAQLERATADRADERSGGQLHLFYVLPSDGTDRALDTNGTIAGSFASVHAWLRQQTEGRGLRLDTFLGEPDITFFQLPESDANVSAMNERVRDHIELRLGEAGLLAPGKVYLAYYDGASTFACGGGAWPPSLPGRVAALYLNGTPPGAAPCNTNPFRGRFDAPGYWEFSGLHELLHTIGIVGECAPHHTRAGHVSDSPADLMYAGNEPWRPARLDVGRDDYYAHDVAGCLDLADSPFMDTQPEIRRPRVVVRRSGSSLSIHVYFACTDSCTAQISATKRGRRFALAFKSLEPRRRVHVLLKGRPGPGREPVYITINAADRWQQYRIVKFAWGSLSDALNAHKVFRPPH
jgi:hypothetical protein